MPSGIAVRRLVGALMLNLIPASEARADYIPSCDAPRDVAVVAPDQAPPALIRALKTQFGEIVAPDEKFDATDVIVVGRNRRFIFIWNVGPKWIVATEHGGRGYNDPIFVYQLSEDRKSATRIAETIAFPGSVCAAARQLAVTP